ncbi:hypothetical protein [Nannocystis bainbridge]|uniref:Uncharacterized protein n=1 Tax=Nannocystis bainbridge TaxID=2995303 RepID=A0ABT5DXU9_9BACT|nr:hypothetical protein [Nannocystis bainbridge]MDC0717924.1 hypothetical protein [Nannocystis bainbridge]
MQLRVLPLLLVTACSPRPLGDTETSAGGTTTTGSGTTASTASPPSPTTGTADPPPGTTGGPDTAETLTDGSTAPPDSSGSEFIAPPDGGPSTKECYQWAQDCPEGQKCMPYSGDGDNAWESLKCVDVVPDPDGLYEPCEVFGSPVSGEDTCDVGLMCWDVVDGKGKCMGMCTGSPDKPGCTDPEASCYLTADAVVTLCFPHCDPLQQDCEADELCLPLPSGDAFICVSDASGEGGQTFDPCTYISACDAGLLCLNPELAVECDPQQIGCCLPFCDTSLPNTCPGAGQECLSWWDNAPPSPELANLGVCSLPQ